MRKLFAAIGAVAVLAPLTLYTFTKLSSAYPVSIAAIERDGDVLNTFGAPRYTVLIGMQFRGSGPWSCTSLIYYVRGAADGGVVNVRLQRHKPKDWDILEVSLGYYTPFTSVCKYTE